MMEETQALNGGDCEKFVGIYLGGRCENLQQTQAQDHTKGNLLLDGHLQFENNPKRQRVGHQIGQDVEGGVGEIEYVDVDAFSRFG